MTYLQKYVFWVKQKTFNVFNDWVFNMMLKYYVKYDVKL